MVIKFKIKRIIDSLFHVTPTVCVFYVWSLFCVVLSVLSSFAIILLRKRELVCFTNSTWICSSLPFLWLLYIVCLPSCSCVICVSSSECHEDPDVMPHDVAFH